MSLDLDDLTRLDREAARVCRGYSIEGEFAVLIRTTPANSFRLIGEKREMGQLAAFLRKAAELIEQGGIETRIADDH